MPYDDHFQLADDYMAHLDLVIGAVADPFIRSRYTGFLAVSAVTVYELALRTVFQDFAQGKHKVLANFTSTYFRRINGRIRLKVIKEDYTKRFGDKYAKRFVKKLERREQEILVTTGGSITSSYENIITWRNGFAHGGQIPQNATYDDVKKAYSLGKHVMHCLAESMRR